MLVLVAAALFGAVVGMSVRNGVVAFILSTALVGLIQFSIMVVAGMLAARYETQDLAERLQAYVGVDLIALAPNVVAAGAAAAIAAVILARGRKAKESDFWLPDQDQRPGGGNRPRPSRHRSAAASTEGRIDKIIRR